MPAGQKVAIATRLGLVVAFCAPGLLLAPVASAQSECLGFSEQTVIDEGTNGVVSILLRDLDGDGDPDVVSASFGDDKIFWYENDETRTIDDPERFKARLISDRIRGAEDVFAADVNGDGPLDLIAAAPESDSVIWFEQAPGDPPLFTARTVTNQAQLVLGVYAADLDGDENTDVLSASFLDDTIAWYQNVPAKAPEGETTFEPPTFKRHVIDDEADGAASVFAADLDGDGDIDVLAASRLDDTIAWYENRDPLPEQEDGPRLFVKHEIATDVPGANAVIAADLDLDGNGRPDVIAVAQAGDAIYWWPNTGAGTFGARRTISDSALGVRQVAVADVDGDGAPDVLSASFRDDTVAWYESTCAAAPCDPLPTFIPRIVSTTATHANDVAAADLDLDGMVDVVSASSVPGTPASQDKLAWYRDVAAVTPPALPEERRISRSADGAVAAFGADLDGDGDVDVATAGRTDRIGWYENDGSTPRPAFAERSVSLDAKGAVDVFVADLDGDGDNDLVSASSDDDKIAWYENDGNTTPGADPLFTERDVSTSADEARDVFVADLDGDLFPDILSASSGDGKLAWYRNLGTSPGAFDAERVIRKDDPATDPPEMSGARSVHVADVNGDGHPDVLGAFHEDGRIRWYENDGAVEVAPPPGTPWAEHEVLDATSEEDKQFALLGATSVFGRDLDGDGDVDLIATAAVGRLVAWFESDGNAPPKFTQHPLATDANEAASAYALDLDQDEFVDILAAVPGDGVIAWFESDGATPPAFALKVLAQSTDSILSTTVADVNGDAVPDVVAGQRLAVSWFEGSGEICGNFDVNDDDKLDGIELAYIGRAFGLSSATPENEWWANADFTGDGMVDGDDLAYLASPGVFGFTTTTCSLICR